MRVLLVSLQPNTDTIGMKYLHSFLRVHGVESHILFVPGYTAAGIPVIKDFLRSFKPDVIGVSLMSDACRQAAELSVEIKKDFPGMIIVWGGIHPTTDPAQCLSFADYVFVGEAEWPFLDFVRACENGADVTRISNLAYLSAGKVVVNAVRPPVKDLDTLPFPEHCPGGSLILDRGRIARMSTRLFKRHSRYSGTFYSLITTRGCNFHCAYCCNSFLSALYSGAGVRTRSVDNIIRELTEAVAAFPGIVYVAIHDDNFFTHGIDWLSHFATRYKKEVGRRFICAGIPSFITADKLRILKDAGLSWLSIGLQSGSEKINREVYHRRTDNEEFLSVAACAVRHRIALIFDVILDNPFETEEDILATVNLILRVPKPYQFQLYSLTLYPGTELYRRAREAHMPIEDPCGKNYFEYRPTYLNKIIRLCPLLPAPLINYFVSHRKSLAAAAVLNALFIPALVILEPLTWFRQILISFDYHVPDAVRTVISYAKTGFSKIVMRRAK